MHPECELQGMSITSLGIVSIDQQSYNTGFNEEAYTKARAKADGETSRVDHIAQSDYDRLDIWRDGEVSLYRR